MTDYIENGEKTNGGELVFSYECDPLTAPQEFLLAKREYAIKTGRDQGERDVIAYHLRQSFKPGECDAETAGKIAWETVQSLTKGKHAFAIAVHTDFEFNHSLAICNEIKPSVKSVLYFQCARSKTTGFSRLAFSIFLFFKY
ncbi:MAG: relaxase/mobilization nuclease domain-containing protein [Clostridiales bacterium]|jgi:hypothetical protein|nr:relaxase/mobilization nuclease domain-containing protein [Clostridiales bacterium]